MEWGKSSDAPFHSGFVSTDQSPRFVLHLCVDVRAIDIFIFNVEFYHGGYAAIYLYVAPLTYYIVARVLV